MFLTSSIWFGQHGLGLSSVNLEYPVCQAPKNQRNLDVFDTKLWFPAYSPTAAKHISFTTSLLWSTFRQRVFPKNGLHKMNILHALETHAVFGGSQQLYFGTNVGSYHLELMGGSFKIILFKYRPRSWCVYIVHDCSIPLTIAFRTATRKGHLVEAASGSNSLQKHAAVKFHFAPQPTVEVTIMHPRKIIYHHLRSTAFSRLHQHETSSQFRIIYIYIYEYIYVINESTSMF